MCRNGRYRERGITGLPGYASEQWCVEADYAVRLDPALADVGVLLEPTSVVAKAWEQIERIGGRSWFDPEVVLVTGAGPIGLLAALLGVQRGLEVHVLDRGADGREPGVTCLTGVSPVGRRIEWDAGALNRSVVLQNDAVFGSVNATLRHYRAAADALARADQDWLPRLITRRVPLSAGVDALDRDLDGVKTVVTLQD
jgi:threonine dehydrogenase-like Zn-dependent dehydrogenase